MLSLITSIGIGFSIVSAGILFAVYALFLRNVNKSWFAIVSCAALLFGLCVLQLHHLPALELTTRPLESVGYLFWLFWTPPTFYFFSRAVLISDAPPSALTLLHLLPLPLPWIVPIAVALPVAFMLGAGYCVWLTSIFYGLRASRERSRLELFFFGTFTAVAILELFLVLSISYIDPLVFYYCYANGISIAFALIIGALLAYPGLLEDLTEAARAKYSATTLGAIDADAIAARLEEVMQHEKLYQDEELNLAMVADVLGVSTHQLSELINTRLQMSFSQYIRRLRINRAKTLLETQPDASVLSLSMEVGFRSQSNFYAAFKEITGESPGQFRRSRASR